MTQIYKMHTPLSNIEQSLNKNYNTNYQKKKNPYLNPRKKT
jgi:hypothetical protein